MQNEILTSILENLDIELSQLDTKSLDSIIYAETAAGICWLTLDEVRKLVIKNGFSSEKEEIHFFKKVKPSIFSKYIYYVKLFEIESYRHNTSKKYQINYLNHTSKALHQFLEQNMQFCQYYWGDKTYHDHLYFLRKNANYRIHPNYICALIDYKYSTAHDNTVSAIIAYENLIEYIDREIHQLRNSGQNLNSQAVSNAHWSYKTVSVVELMYAIHSAAVINNGNIEIKELAELFSKMFNIKLDDYYRTFSDIQMRKTNRTKFLDTLKAALLKRMDDSDAKTN